MALNDTIRDKIASHAKAQIDARNDIDADAVNLHLCATPLPKGASLLGSDGPGFVLPQPSAVVLADKAPLYNWGHPCEHFLYNVSGDHYHTHVGEFPIDHYFMLPDMFEPIHHPVNRDMESLLALLDALPSRYPELNEALALAGRTRYAILFAGMTNNRHLNDLEFLYRTLLDVYYFDPKNIIVLNWNGTLTYSGNPQPVASWPGDNTPYRIKIDGAGTSAALLGALDTVKAKLKEDDLLLIHTNNHGGGPPTSPAAWLCCYPNWASCTPAQFGAKLATLPRFATLMVMMEQCHSGGFQSSVIDNTTARSTTFAAAADVNHSSMGGADFDPYAKDWIAAMASHYPNGSALSRTVSSPASAKEAADYATAVKVAGDTPVFAEKPVSAGAAQHLGFKKTLAETAVHMPGAAVLRDRLYLGWAGTDSKHRLNVIQMDNTGTWSSKVTLGDTSEQGVSLQSFAGKLFMAWSGRGNHQLNVMCSGNGVDWFDKVTLGETSKHNPVLGVHRGSLVLAWTGMDERLNVLFSPDGRAWSGKQTLGETSIDSPQVETFNTNLFIAWTGTDSAHQLNVMSSANRGASWQNKRTLGDTSVAGPGLQALSDRLVMSWSGRDSKRSINTLTSTDGATWADKRTLDGDYSDYTPTLAPILGLCACWTGRDSHLNIMRLHA